MRVVCLTNWWNCRNAATNNQDEEVWAHDKFEASPPPPGQCTWPWTKG